MAGGLLKILLILIPALTEHTRCKFMQRLRKGIFLVTEINLLVLPGCQVSLG